MKVDLVGPLMPRLGLNEAVDYTAMGVIALLTGYLGTSLRHALGP